MRSDRLARSLDRRPALTTRPRLVVFQVEGVASGSPASAIGLQAGTLKVQVAGQSFTLGGDVILSINGVIIGSPDFSNRVDEKNRSLTGDDHFVLRVLRDGNVIELKRLVSVLGLER